jgi:DNA modification methylase
LDAANGLTPKARLADRYETVLIFSKGAEPTFNPNSARLPQKFPGKRAEQGPNKGKLSGNPLGAWSADVWSDIPSVRNDHPDRKFGNHPAQFPVNLARRAILLYTLSGDTVCDVFMGSGSTALASIETGRHFIGADLGYEELRAKRVAAATPDTVNMLHGVTDQAIALWQMETTRVEHTAVAISIAKEQEQGATIF